MLCAVSCNCRLFATHISSSNSKRTSPAFAPPCCIVRPAHTCRRSLPPLRYAQANRRPVHLAQAQPDHAAVAEEAVAAAAKVTLKYFRSLVDVETKPDTSPVTAADREAEEAIIAVLKQHCPDYGILGEESGYDWPGEAGQAEYLWVIDPIDGTKSFITGKPLWGTLLALLHKGEPILGIIDQPYTKERWVGMKGRPTTFNGEEVHAKDTKELEAAYLYATSPHMFEIEDQFSEAWDRLRGKVRLPLYGADCYAYGLLASGHADLVAECDMKPYDYLAHVPIVQGAGGVVTDWQGGALKWQMLPSGAWVDKSMPGDSHSFS
ncbi:hypothetical protein WJX84_002154 [Apatococcus fuscideae]|uniref:Histidinol-phosphatase n=1 Tax=Apatococcus fuscideae TaxID=2026836 RepID=A0AAW1RNQ9_9CHLO